MENSFGLRCSKELGGRGWGEPGVCKFKSHRTGLHSSVSEGGKGYLVQAFENGFSQEFFGLHWMGELFLL